jgi:glycosyltransferase involved in cell wall biosynthesis
MKTIKIAFIGSAGVPNKYGGFESFLEHCGPILAKKVSKVMVTCDKRLYSDFAIDFNGVTRILIDLPANGCWSILHDLLAFFSVYARSTHIVVLGVSGAPWFPLFRLMCALSGKKLLVNIDGVEWRRGKFGYCKRLLLRIFDAIAQRFANVIVYDNPGLKSYILKSCTKKSICIGYSGDQVLRIPQYQIKPFTALTICRIEVENNLEMLIAGFLLSTFKSYTIVGNWLQSEYGRNLKLRYSNEPRLCLLDSIYDLRRLAELRESCAVYLHGHSVGGTNPSLVEMLFYDCHIACLDVVFNRETAGGCAHYFSNHEDLSFLFGHLAMRPINHDRGNKRTLFTRSNIANQYFLAMDH